MTGPPDDQLDLAALRRQDAAEFARLVDRHQPIVLGLCQSMGLSGADLDDAAAEVFAGVYRALPRFEGRSALSTWVYRIAARTIPKVRARYRRGLTSSLPEEHPSSGEPSPLEQTETAEAHRRLWDAVAALDEREAMAVEMHYRREWPLEQIAEVLQCPIGTVKTLLFRARNRLRDVLTRQEASS